MACRSAANLIISTKVRYLRRCASARCSSLSESSQNQTDILDMTKRRFAKRWAFAAILAAAFAAPAVAAEQAGPPPKAGRPINARHVLSGELTLMQLPHVQNHGNRPPTHQLPRHPPPLPPP